MSPSGRRPMFTPAERQAVLERAIELLETDDRVEAVVLTGSLGRDEADRWSDIDLDAVIAEGVDVGAVAADWDGRVYREWPVAHHYATSFDETLVRGYLLDTALLLDLAFTPIGAFEVWAPVRVLRDRTGRTTSLAAAWSPWSPTPDPGGEAGFAAHDILHACVAVNRGRRWQSLYFLQRIRSRILALASERHGWDAQDLTRADDLPVDEVAGLERSLVSSLDRGELLDAVEQAAHAFLAELRRHDSALADRLARPLLDLVATSKQA